MDGADSVRLCPRLNQENKIDKQLLSESHANLILNVCDIRGGCRGKEM